jgi:hypothetical protein
MKRLKENRNACFNFRLKLTEMDYLRKIAHQLGYLSFAEFIRTAIREKINREIKNGS